MVYLKPDSEQLQYHIIQNTSKTFIMRHWITMTKAMEITQL